MKNLKRVLSLALSGIMLVGMMTVGASAVNGKDFTDADEIQHTEAVNTLVTLNVINGKDDGSHYDPKGTLTRAEMAKLIVYVLNGGQEPVMSTKATPTYTDIKGHWAEKYIEYCSNLKIVAGQGDGTFNPGGTLTGSQAAKMMLVAMSYDSNVFGFTGTDWELNVNSEANKAGLYDELNGLDPAAEISRDAAAQLVYNGMLASTMKLSYSQSLSDGKVTQNYDATGKPLFNTKFNGQSYEGILVSSGKYAIAGVPDGNGTVTASKDYFKIQLKKIDGVELTSSTDLDKIQQFKSSEDLTALMGERVRVLWNTSKREIYGVYSMAGENFVIHTTSDKVPAADQKADTIKIDGTTYDTSKALTADDTYADNLKFVDNDNDGKLDIVVENKVGLYKVTYVGSTTFTLSHVSGQTTATAANQKLEDVTAYEGMKKDDYVLVSKDMYNAKDLIVKAEPVETTIGGTRDKTNPMPGNPVASDYEYRVDGAWAGLIAGYGTLPTNLGNGKSVDVIKLGGKIAYIKVTESSQSLSDVVMLITTNSKSNNNGIDNQQAKLLFADGTKKTVTVSTEGATPAATDCGKLYTFEMDGSNYKLTELTANGADVGDYKKTSGDITAANGKIATVGTTDIADDAVVFLFKGASDDKGAINAVVASAYNDGKIITGKDLKGLDVVDTAAKAATGATASGVLKSTVALTVTNNGITKIGVLSANCTVLTDATTNSVVEATWPTGTSSANYGFIVAKPYTTKENGKSYVVYPTWNGEETVDYKVEGTSVKTGIAKYSVIGYDLGSGDEIKNIQAISVTKAAITGLDGKEVQFDATVNGKAAGTTFKTTGDTVYLFVNGDEGVDGGELQRATEVASGKYAQNVKVLVNNSNEIELIVVDTENKLADADTMSKALSATITNAGVTFSKNNPAVGDIVTVTVTADSGKTIAVTDASFGVTGDCVLSGTYTLNGDATVLSFDVLFIAITSESLTISGVTAS